MIFFSRRSFHCFLSILHRFAGIQPGFLFGLVIFFKVLLVIMDLQILQES